MYRDEMLVITIGYGEEHEVYRQCRKIWELFLMSHAKSDVRVYFVQSITNQSEDFVVRGHDLFIKVQDPEILIDIDSSSLPKVNSDWSFSENNLQVFRNKRLFHWLLQNFGESGNYLYGTTVTSIHSISVLQKIISALPRENVYAGYPCLFPGKFLNFHNFVFLSGSNSLWSFNLLTRLIHDDPIDFKGLPNDVWAGARLSNIQRTVLPRYDIEYDSKYLLTALSSSDLPILNEIKTAICLGHFHFRVKSKGEREVVDHLVLMEVYKCFLLCEEPRLVDIMNLSRQHSGTS